ncbi:hypothetical protein RCO28_30860 [Streptomyces sp. LHD-70]|uniref:hypothetical protein n=1 Tax=Streptomyces sp. LHD-70 TaxID=3072140 RepID=UPI00280FE30E|nr:hypothetical protein [Streptomyces sp. LHD-70]MDQ8706838.1 hypothetical protein [Streptomyces sp. LHD-70]
MKHRSANIIGSKGNALSRLQISALTVSTTALALAFSVGCSAPTKQYAIPKDLCGIQVKPNLVEPLLPPGEKLNFRSSSTGEHSWCRVEVDGKTPLSVMREWWSADTTVSYLARGALGVSPYDKQTKDRRYIYSRTGAIGQVECPESRKDGKKLFASVRVTSEVTEAEMKRFIIGYTKSVATSEACEAGA